MAFNPPDNRFGPDDNLSMWTKQYPALLEKNFIGIARTWDKQFPPVTFDVLPPRNMPFHFSWRVMIDPSILAPFVQEGADTPMSDAQAKMESFVCRESRLGAKISQREIGFGLPNVVQQRTTQLVDSINLTRVWDNIQALTGNNVNQPLALTRLNLADSGKPHGVGTAKAWNESGAKIIDDIIAMKTDITKKCGEMPTDVYMPLDEYEAMHGDSNILDQLKYTQGDLLVNGRLTMIKGLKIHLVANFWKERKKDGTEVKHYLLEDKVVVVAPSVGFTAVAEPMEGSAPQIERWYEAKQRSIFMHAFSSFTSVIEDYGKIGIIQGTNVLV